MVQINYRVLLSYFILFLWKKTIFENSIFSYRDLSFNYSKIVDIFIENKQDDYNISVSLEIVVTRELTFKGVFSSPVYFLLQKR